MLCALAEYCNIGCQHLDPIANSHCGDPAGKCVHPGFAAISQDQCQVWAVYCNDQTRYSGPCSDIHYCAGNTYEGINK